MTKFVIWIKIVNVGSSFLVYYWKHYHGHISPIPPVSPIFGQIQRKKY